MRKLFRRMFASDMAPPGPAMFDFEERIAASAERIFALLDFADPRNAKHELGHAVEATGPGSFRFTMTQMPDLPFAIHVNEAVSGRSYAYRAQPECEVGQLQWTEERYVIVPQGDGTCLLTLLVEAQFNEPLPTAEYALHVARMAHGCSLALEKLRIHAEQGVAAVAEFEARQFA